MQAGNVQKERTASRRIPTPRQAQQTDADSKQPPIQIPLRGARRPADATQPIRINAKKTT